MAASAPKRRIAACSVAASASAASWTSPPSPKADDTSSAQAAPNASPVACTAEPIDAPAGTVPGTAPAAARNAEPTDAASSAVDASAWPAAVVAARSIVSESLIAVLHSPPQACRPVTRNGAGAGVVAAGGGVSAFFWQPYVTAIFNFLLRDQPELNRWQSGVLWTDGTPKASYVAWRGAIAEANSGTVNCSLFADPSAQPPTGAGDEPASGTTNRPPQTKTPPPPFEPATIAPHVLTIAWAGTVGRVYGRENRRWRRSIRCHTSGRRWRGLGACARSRVDRTHDHVDHRRSHLGSDHRPGRQVIGEGPMNAEMMELRARVAALERALA